MLASALKRAIRDNDLVYVSPVPPVSQLALITPASMVKLTVPAEIANSLDWLLKDPAAGGALFSGLVPYGVHVALSECATGHTAEMLLDGRRAQACMMTGRTRWSGARLRESGTSLTPSRRRESQIG